MPSSRKWFPQQGRPSNGHPRARDEIESDIESDDGQKYLSMLAASQPVQREQSSSHVGSHMMQQSPEQTDDQDEEDLTEMAAPAPVQEEDQSGSWRREEHLEEGEEQAAAESLSAQWRPNERVTLLYTVAYLIFFSFWGTLARLGVQWLGFYPGAPVVISNLWANFGGCLVMGFFSEDRNIFDTSSRQHRKLNEDEDSSKGLSKGHDPPISKKGHPMFIGLTTGFCGCFTSFSTFARDMFLALSNSVATPINHPFDSSSPSSYHSRNAGWSVTAVLAVIILTLCVNLSALKFGAHIALATQSVTKPLPHRGLRKFVDPAIVFLAAGCWLGAILLAALPNGSRMRKWRGEALFALVFAPVGCLLRWQLSRSFNARMPSFPIGTFAANIFGVAILAMCYDIQHSRASVTAVGGIIGCQVLQGVEDGFCGCLTTVSTWMLELTTLKRRHAYRYGVMSVSIALAVVVVLMGSVKWGRGYVDAACTTETS